jgi:hypothetical protein
MSMEHITVDDFHDVVIHDLNLYRERYNLNMPGDKTIKTLTKWLHNNSSSLIYFSLAGLCYSSGPNYCFRK